MLLFIPPYPPGPYRFIDHEYLIIADLTDPARLRAVVPEPLELDQRTGGQIGIRPCAELDRLVADSANFIATTDFPGTPLGSVLLGEPTMDHTRELAQQ